MTTSSRFKYCINGRFLTRQITGVDRYAREIVHELDSLLGKGEAVLLLPEDCAPIDWEATQNIELRHYGKRKGHAWEQLDLSRYVRKNGLLAINLCNTAPVLNPGVVCIHDMNVRANPSFYGWKFRTYYRAMFWFLTRRAKLVLTVTHFSESEIEKYYPCARGRISVVPCAWQHIERVVQDNSVLERTGLESGAYYFAMSSLAPNKNLKWIVETARLNPGCTFAVAGGINTKVFGEHDIPEADNVKYLGYVSDEEAKALMSHCRAFLYPTFYEGFGMPPMEAMASGAQAVVVGDNPCMHEVYGESVCYINPNLPCHELDSFASFEDNKAERQTLLGKYSWTQSADMLKMILDGVSSARMPDASNANSR